MDYAEEVLNLEQAICEKSQVVIGNVNYVVSSFFSPSGNESVYDQFMRLLTANLHIRNNHFGLV